MRGKVIKVLFSFFLIVLIGAMFRAMLGNATFMTSKELLLYFREHSSSIDPRIFIKQTLDNFKIFDNITASYPKSFSDTTSVLDFLRLVLEWIVFIAKFIASCFGTLFKFLGGVFGQLFSIFKFLFDFLTYYMFGV